MQLKSNRDVKRVLAAASASLLALNPAQAQEAWEVDAEILYYQEQDDRVQDVSFKSLAKGAVRDDDQLTLSLQYDTLTGASPTGAATQNATQTFTSASGNGTVVVPANELPLDDSFQDTRVALSGNYQHLLASGARFSNGLTFSKEYDYTHLGVNTAYAFDFDNNNRTLSVGLGLANDTVESVGGNPAPNTFVPSDGASGFKANDKDKTVVDLLVGFTQIINRRSLVQINYSASVFDGYLNDPYKFISVLDDNGGLEAAGGGLGGLYRFESRPDSRTGHNLYVEYKYRFDKSIANLAYRYHTDDWGIDSHTLETRFRWLIDAKQWIEPNFRIYSQSAADFYVPFVFDSNLPNQASSDYRLNEFTGVTVGLSYKRQISRNNTVGFSFDSYKTTGADASVTSPTGEIVTANSSDLTASIFRVNYSFKF